MPAPLAPDFRPQYHELHRVGRPGWWRSLLGAILLVVLVFGIVPAGRWAWPPSSRCSSAAPAPRTLRAMLDVTTEVTPAGLAAAQPPARVGASCRAGW